MNLVDAYFRSLSDSSPHVALSHGEDIWTHEELAHRIAAFASGVRERGLQMGDRVALALGNSPAFVIAYLGTLAAGGCVVPLNVLIRPREWLELAHDCSPRLLVAEPRLLRLLRDSSQELNIHELAPEDGKDPFSKVQGRALRGPLPRLSSDPAVLLYTAAYSGRARGAILTHGSLLANLQSCIEAWQVTANERIAAFLPLFHGFGAMTCFLTPLLAGGESVLLERFTPEAAMEQVQARQVSILPVVPTMLLQFLKAGVLTRESVSSIRNWTAGGSALPDEMVHAVEKACGSLVLQGYGLTENSPVVSVNRDAQRHKLGSVGTPLQGVQVAIEKNGKRLAPGEEGEVLVSGPSVMSGYWKDDDTTARFLRDGWLHTRDRGYLDEEGYLFLTGRTQPLVISGGFNIYPAEIERVLETHPQVKTAQAIGLPDPIFGESLLARIELLEEGSTTGEELSSWCRRQMSAYKIPRKWEFSRPG